MSPLPEIIDGNSSWKRELTENERSIFSQLEQANGGVENALIAWLDLSAPQGISPVGATGGSRPYYEAFQDALYEKLCGRSNEAERAELVKSAGLSHGAFVGALTASISPLLGAAPGFIAPAIAVSLHMIGTTGLEAWCKVQTDRRKNR